MANTLVRPLIGFALLTASGYAQTQDVRLSDSLWEPIQVSVTNVQFAAEIGTTTLVVWLGNVREDDTIRLRLRAQILRNREPIGVPFVIGTRDDRPDGSLHIATAYDRFLVVWNDARDSSRRAAYVVAMDTNGNYTPEQIFSAGAAFGRPGVFVVPDGKGYRLLWNSDSSFDVPSMWRGMDSTGMVTADSGRSPLSIARVILARRGNDTIYVDAGPRGLYRVLISGNAWTPIPPPGSGLIAIATNGSMARVDSNYLLVFPSFLDSTRFNRLSVPNYSCVNGTLIASWDHRGRIGVCWLTASWREAFGQRDIVATANFAPVIADTGIGIPEVVGTTDATTSIYPPWMDLSVSPGSATTARYCSGLIRARFPITVNYHFMHGGVSGSGTNYLTGDVICSGYAIYTNAYPSYAIDACYDKVESWPVVSQSAGNIYASQVTVSWPDEKRSLVLTLPKPLVHVGGVVAAPIVAPVNGLLSAAWKESNVTAALVLKTWDPRNSDRVDSISTLRIGRDTIPGVQSSIRLRDVGDDRYVALRVDSFKVSRIRILEPGPAGWKDLYHFIIPDDQANEVVSVFSDPDDGLTMLTSAAKGATGQLANLRIAFVQGDSTTIWPDTLFASPTDSWAVAFPVDRTLFGVATSSEVFTVDSNATRAHVYRARALGVIRPFPLRGNEFVVIGVDSNQLRLEWFAVRGNRYAHVLFYKTVRALPLSDIPPYTLTGSTPIWNVTIAQNPTDSGLAVVYGSTHGVRMTTLDVQGHVKVYGEQISESNDTCRHPSAVYLGDTLYVVWENHHNGLSEIYGTRVFAQTSGAPWPTDQREQSGDDLFAIVPNPTRTRLTIQLRQPSSTDVEYSIVDVTGTVRIEGTIPRGTGSQVVEIDRLTPGSYFTIVTQDDARETRRVEVLSR